MSPHIPDINTLIDMRAEYRGGLLEQDLAVDWTTQFARWLAEAVAAGIVEPNAAVLATADSCGVPSARTVLLKGCTPAGFTFFTNLLSRKAREVAENPRASLVFGWHAMGRQVVVCGSVHPVDRAETEAYFATRPRGAQLGAWASAQSSVLDSRADLERAAQAVAARFGDADAAAGGDGGPVPMPVPAPPHWGGLRLAPVTVEFWQGRPDRLHDRLRFRDDGGTWVIERLSP